MPAAPAASCALCIGRTHTSNNEYTRTPGIPARNGFNGLCRALPGDRALLPPSSADRFCLSPVGPTQLRVLDASVGASGPHDFAVRSSISRQRAVDRSQVPKNPPCDPVARKTLPRPPHPSPTSVTIAKRPSVWDGMRKVLDLIWGERKRIYFLKCDWTGQIRLNRLNKFAAARKPIRLAPAP